MTSAEVAPAEPAVGRRGALALAVAGAVDAVPGVRRSGGTGRPGGLGAEISTQYPGGKVLGIALGDDSVTIHLVAERLPLGPLIDQVHAGARRVVEAARGGRVDVVIDDLDVAALPGRQP